MLSCGVHKEIVKKSHTKRLKLISDKKLLKKTTKNYLSYEYLTLKFSGKVQWENTSKSIRGIIKTKRDSIVWISMYHSSGIPITKIVLTKDSIIFLNRLNNTYYTGDYDFLEDQLNFSLTFNNVQGILLNELFLYNDTITKLKELKDFKRYSDTTCYALQSVKKKAFRKYSKKQRKNKRIKRKWRDGFTIQGFRILPDTFKIKEMSVKDIPNKMKFTVNYADFKVFLNKLFPRNLKISIFTPNDTIKTNLKIKKITKNESLKFSLKIPSKATKIQ